MFGIKEIRAGTTENFYGWAWSENIGWISFNSLNCDTNVNGYIDVVCGGDDATTPIIDYGVNVESGGYIKPAPGAGPGADFAWSENIGWISFNRAITGPPPDVPDYNPYLAWVNVASSPWELNGWARACGNPPGGLPIQCGGSGDWDGWIKFRGPGYGVTATNMVFSGWAWGSNVIGWISFNCLNEGVCGVSNYEVSINHPPAKPVPAGAGETWNHCSIQALSIPTLSWVYSDPIDGDPQIAYEIRIDNDSDFSVIDGDEYRCSGMICSGGNSNAFTPVSNEWGNWMSWNTDYWWIVRVQDIRGGWSEWSDSSIPPDFTTPLHAYPWANFVPDPQSPSIGEKVFHIQDDDVLPIITVAYCYDSAFPEYRCEDDPYGVITYQWDLPFNMNEGFIISTDEKGNTSSTYAIVGDYQVTLTIDDSTLPESCSQDRTVSVGLAVPEWREITPIILFEELYKIVKGYFEGFYKSVI